MSISNATMASRSPSVASRTSKVGPPGWSSRGLLLSGIGPEHRAAALGAARGLERGDARPPAARPDLVHGPRSSRTGRAAATAARLSAVYRAPSWTPAISGAAAAVLRRWYRWLVPPRTPAPR